MNQIYNDLSHIKDWPCRDQVQRAAISTMNNIAEGFERSSDADFRRFLIIAKGSCGEVRSMTYLLQDLNYINTAKADKLRNAAIQLSAQIGSLIKYLGKSKV
ncbi:MAG: four helix bundle protein [candidate division KSB1 bacterium]|nr:four helix bundle protein [candidate division KSB1 bacterium]